MSDNTHRMARAVRAYLRGRPYDDGLLSVAGDALMDKGIPVIQRWTENVYVVRGDQVSSGAARERLSYAARSLAREIPTKYVVRASPYIPRPIPESSIQEAVKILTHHPPDENQPVYGFHGYRVGQLTKPFGALAAPKGGYLDAAFKVDGAYSGSTRGCMRPHKDGWILVLEEEVLEGTGLPPRNP